MPDPTSPPPSGSVESVELTAGDGVKLEGELAVPARPWAAALLCHPHPAQGGSMRSIVTSAQFRDLPGRGVACLRFNFRGVEGSGGTHGGGTPERLDIAAGLDLLFPLVEGLPLVLAGWSFGADTSLTVVDERVDGWCAVAPPLRVFPDGDYVAGGDDRPKLLVVPEHDQFRPPDAVMAATARWRNTEIRVAAGADHFMVGRLDDAIDGVVDVARAGSGGD